MELYQIRYYLAVCETGSFKQAAERVHVTQPTLSAGIAKLEKLMGVSLFERHRRGVRLTHAGQQLLPHAQAIQHAMRNARQSVKEEPEAQQRLNLGVLNTLDKPRVAQLLSRFVADHDEISLSVYEDRQERLRERLVRGHLHAVLGVVGNEETLNQHKLFSSHLSLIAANNSKWVTRHEWPLEALNGETFILRRHCEFFHAALEHFNVRAVRPNILMRCKDDTLALQLVLQGVGVTVATDRLLRPGLTAIDLQGLKLRHAIGLLWQEERNSGVAALLRYCKSHRWRDAPGRQLRNHIDYSR